MPHCAHLAAVLNRVVKRHANTRIDFGMQNSNRRIEPSSTPARPSGFERPDGGAVGEFEIETNVLKPRNAGEHLTADATGAEESKRGVALRSLVRYAKRSGSSAGTNERLWGLSL